LHGGHSPIWKGRRPEADAPCHQRVEPLLLLHALLAGVIPHLASFLAILLVRDS